MSFTMKDAYSVMLREYPDVMNIEQMSQALGVSTKTGYGLLKSGKVACLRVGRAYRIWSRRSQGKLTDDSGAATKR